MAVTAALRRVRDACSGNADPDGVSGRRNGCQWDSGIHPIMPLTSVLGGRLFARVINKRGTSVPAAGNGVDGDRRCHVSCAITSGVAGGWIGRCSSLCTRRLRSLPQH
jgi:hypothetical protein